MGLSCEGNGSMSIRESVRVLWVVTAIFGWGCQVDRANIDRVNPGHNFSFFSQPDSNLPELPTPGEPALRELDSVPDSLLDRYRPRRAAGRTRQRGDSALFGLKIWDGQTLSRWFIEIDRHSLRCGPEYITTVEGEQVRGENYRVTVTPFDGSEPQVRNSSSMIVGVTVYSQTGERLSRDFAAAPELFLREGFWSACRDFECEPEAQLELKPIQVSLALFETLKGVDSLAELLRAAIPRPSIWSLIINWGPTVSIIPRLEAARRKSLDNAIVGMSQLALPLYEFPLDLYVNDQLSLSCSITAAPAEGPVDLGAGVLAVEAIEPGGPRRVLLELLAVRSGSSAGNLRR